MEQTQLTTQPFNLKQREMMARMLADAKERAKKALESDDDLESRVKDQVLPKLAKEHGAAPLIENLRLLRQQVDITEDELKKVGFTCDDESISLHWKAPNKLEQALKQAQRSARKERDAELQRFDRAILDVWAASDAAEAKKIAEKLL